MELTNAALNFPRGGLCSPELVINGPTPPPTFLCTKEGRGALIGTPAILAASVRMTVVRRCADLPPNPDVSYHVRPPPLPPCTGVEVWLLHVSLECSSLFGTLGGLICVRFMFNLKFLFFPPRSFRATISHNACFACRSPSSHLSVRALSI